MKDEGQRLEIDSLSLLHGLPKQDTVLRKFLDLYFSYERSMLCNCKIISNIQIGVQRVGANVQNEPKARLHCTVCFPALGKSQTFRATVGPTYFFW